MQKGCDSAMDDALRTQPDGSLLADTVVARIRDLIATGKLQQGERVKELEISQDLGISRGPVREAVRRLASSGLLVSAPNLGSRVIVLTESSVRQAYQVREVLESLAANLAATNMAAQERSALLEMLDRHAAVMRASSPTGYPAGDSDWDFHLRILRGSGNDFVWRICGVDLRDIMALMRAQHRSSERRGIRALQEHRWIAEAIAEGNGDLAGLLMAQHIRASRDNLLAGMQRHAGTKDT
jgi:DNA-binding GntR family transcriptional regulator